MGARQIIPLTDKSYARRKANRWLAEHVGDMLMADHPLLTHSGERQIWRFGVYVTSLQRDPFGPVVYVDVDAETGAVLMDEAAAGEIAQRGERLEKISIPFSPARANILSPLTRFGKQRR